ncbi:MAG: hypothetical protein JJ921_10445 [Pseudomonadales bacterium]|nr:hypothetical protein [Pseudomonadales bacterium]
MCLQVKGFRDSLLVEGNVISKQMDGGLPSNPVDNSNGEVRKEQVALGQLDAGKVLSEEFTLFVKHNALFSSLLPELQKRFETFCIVRNPLPVLASWQSVDLPVARGTVPMAERFDGKLQSKLSEAEAVMQKQLVILSWFFDRYRGQENLIRYESLVETNGRTLFDTTGVICNSSEPLEPQLKNTGASNDQLRRLSDCLLERPEIYEGFYSPEDVSSQLEAMLS